MCAQTMNFDWQINFVGVGVSPILFNIPGVPLVVPFWHIPYPIKNRLFFVDVRSDDSYLIAGMICPHIVDWSMLLGAVLAHGVMWPAIAAKAGVNPGAGKH